MRAKFPLFNSHLDLAHHWWQSIVTDQDWVIDMTCGNGHDAKFLASLNPKRLVALDIQAAALEQAKKILPANVELLLVDHAEYPLQLDEESVKLAVYNLGWLPGSNKSCTTTCSSTLTSLERLYSKIKLGGMIFITCYPGHEEGKKEESALLKALSHLEPTEWSICHHQWLNRQAAPSLLILQRRQQQQPKASLQKAEQ